MGMVGMMPSRCYVDVDDTHLRVRMGMWFELDTERTVVRSVAPDHGRVLGWGVHGWRGQWLVNGSASGLVRIELEPSVRAWMGPAPLRVRVLRVSVDDPDGLVAALAPATTPGAPPRARGTTAREAPRPADDRGRRRVVGVEPTALAQLGVSGGPERWARLEPDRVGPEHHGVDPEQSWAHRGVLLAFRPEESQTCNSGSTVTVGHPRAEV